MKAKILSIFIIISIFSNATIAQDIVENYSKTEFINLDKNTKMVYKFENENLIEKGILKNGKREGVWQSFNENGNLLVEASFADGLKNGVWIIYNGMEIKYVLHYQDGKRMKASDLARLE